MYSRQNISKRFRHAGNRTKDQLLKNVTHFNHGHGIIILFSYNYYLVNTTNDMSELFYRMLEQSKGSGNLDINCCDPLGRTALLMAIDNENLEIIEMLIDNKVSYPLMFNIF